jgi:ketosteroid isomerase-like protein
VYLGPLRHPRYSTPVASENIELVRNAYAIWNEGWHRSEPTIPPGLLADDFELDLTANVFNPDLYRGREGFLRFLQNVLEVWDEFRMEPEELVEVGEHVVVLVRAHGRGKGSGIEVDDRVTQVWTVRGGKVSRIKNYLDHCEALASVGVASQS